MERRPLPSRTFPSAEALQDLGRSLGRLQPEGLCLGLVGDLGAGKTTFTQGLGEGLGVQSDITSPTFGLMVEHEADCPLLHVDAYRLAPGEAEGIGLEETLEDWPGLSVVEWADLVMDELPVHTMFLRIRIVPGGRTVEVEGSSGRWEPILQRWWSEP